MATVVDELVTRMTLDPSGYQSGAAAVSSSTSHLASKLGSLTGAAVRSVALASGAGVAGMIAMSVFAVKTAISYDTLKRSLEAITKSGERAKEVLRFTDILAGPSVFGSEELAQAALTLEAFGLATERYLPIVEKLGTVFGGTTSDLAQFVNALGMLKGGRAGEAFEALSRAGISRESLSMRGLKFSKAGELQSSVSEALSAIEAEVNARFGRLSESMASGPAAKMASMWDAMKVSIREIGYGIVTIVQPAIEKLSSAIAYLNDSGIIKSVTAQFTSLFSGEGLGNWLTNALFTVVATIKRIPDVLAAVGKTVTSVFTSLRQHMLGFAMLTGAIFGALFVGRFITAIGVIVKGYQAWRAAITATTLAQVVLEAIATGGLNLLRTAGGALAGALAAAGIYKVLESAIPSIEDFKPGGVGDVVKGISSDAEKMSADFAKSLAKGAVPGATKAVAEAKSEHSARESISAQRQTAQNTKKLVEQNEKIQRMIIGGGSTAAKGVTATELSARQVRKGGKNHAEALAGVISAWIDDRFFEIAISQARGTRF